MILVEDTYGHGALPQKGDLRDLKYTKLAKASQPFNWEVGFDAERTPGPVKDQGQSSSCGGQSAAYLEAIIQAVFSERSAKYIYSQIYYPDGGTTLRDILKFLAKKGSASETSVPSYQNGQPPSEMFMRDQSQNAAADSSALTYRTLGYAFVDPDIESYAQAIRDNGGAIMQINGQNNGTWLLAEPVGPSNKTALWSHFLVCTGAMMRNGKKVIKVKNSWGPNTGDHGYQYIDEDYFRTGQVLQGGVVYSNDNPIIIAQKITLMTQIIALLQKLINIKRALGQRMGGIIKASFT